MKIKEALIVAQGYAVEGAAHVLAVWLTAARWIKESPHWTLVILIALLVYGAWVKF